MEQTVGVDTVALADAGAASRIDGAGVAPIFRSTIWEEREGDGYHDIRYPRLSNLPNHVQMGEKVADLEGGEAGLVTASGMAAISATLICIAGATDHLLIQKGVITTEDLVNMVREIDLEDGVEDGRITKADGGGPAV